MAKITIKELESLTANDAGRILREDGNLAGRISARKDACQSAFSIVIGVHVLPRRWLGAGRLPAP
jgi:hypothetical protein